MISGKHSVNINGCTYILEQGECILIPTYAKHSFGNQYREFESLMASFVISGDNSRLINIAAQNGRLSGREMKTLPSVVVCYQDWIKGDFAAAEETVCRFAILLRQIQSTLLLKSTGLSVAEIAERIGFSTANGFLLVIKRECHRATPKSFRKKSGS